MPSSSYDSNTFSFAVDSASAASTSNFSLLALSLASSRSRTCFCSNANARALSAARSGSSLTRSLDTELREDLLDPVETPEPYLLLGLQSFKLTCDTLSSACTSSRSEERRVGEECRYRW